MDATSTTEPFRFAAATAPLVGDDALVRETRREIAGIVRECAQLARQDIPATSFFHGLIDRVAQAMAAEGVVIWRRRDEPAGFQPVARVGRITDQAIDVSQADCHQRMLTEVAEGEQPVVVPSTPDALESSLPANPTIAPVAVVPILESQSQSIEYLLEVFLEGDGGPATQRGYLRFASQMADLAGDYLRLQRIRDGQRAERRWKKLSQGLPAVHGSLDAKHTFTRIVDTAAEIFESDRVSLCQRTPRGTRLVAVSHVDDIDHRAAEAIVICRAVDRFVASDAHKEGSMPIAWFATELSMDMTGPTENEVQDAGDASHQDLSVEAVVQVGAASEYCSEYCLVLQRRDLRNWEESLRYDLQHYSEHAAGAIRNAESFSRIPWARAAATLIPQTGFRLRGRARMVVLAMLACVIGVFAAMPVPLIVTARAELSAIGTQFLYAPADGVVSEIRVRHGQSVRTGDALLTITDRRLEEQVEVLVGQRAVLVERMAELSTSLTDQTLRRREDQLRLQSEQQIIRQQMDSIDRQLAILSEQRENLVLRSDRDGVVDGWQLERSFQGRPVAAGQSLLSVIQPAHGWQVEAYVPQNRLDHVLTAAQQASSQVDRLQASVVLRSHPDQVFQGALVDIGPSITVSADEGPAARVLFALSADEMPKIQTGAPASVAIDCGRRPLVYVALQDFIRAVRGLKGMYL